MDEIYRKENLDVWGNIAVKNQIIDAKEQAAKSEILFREAAEYELAKTSEQEQE